MRTQDLRDKRDLLPETLPIFPLPGALLLPGGRLPLNIFEPRYLAMTDRALASSRMIGMVQPRDSAPAESGDKGQAKIFSLGCAGRIVAFSETEDGRYLITLEGLLRFRVMEELPLDAGGFRAVVPDFAPFQADLRHPETARIDRAALLAALEAYFRTTGIQGDWSAIEKTEDCHLVTSLAMLCPLTAGEKQALLECADLEERAKQLTAMLQMASHGAAGQEHIPRH